MKILMAHKFHYYRGGDSTYMFNLSALLRERGHEVAHFAMNHPENIESEYSRYFAPEIDFPALLEDPGIRSSWEVAARSIYNWEARRRISSLIEDFNPDIAHFHNIHAHLTTSIIEPLRKRGVPIVWTLHDYRVVCPNTSFLCRGEVCERCLPRKYYNVLLHRCKKGSLGASAAAMAAAYFERMTGTTRKISRFIAPSRFLRDKIIEGRIDPGRISVIPNFVDLEAYRPSGEEGDHFLYFGRLSHEKGVDVLIRAAASLGRGRLMIAGDGPDTEELKSLAGRLGAENIEFAGFMGREELGEAIDKSMFVVLPSLWYENLPFSVMEAFALGKPVIASNIGGIPEMVDDGVNGLLFPPGDEGALAEALGILLDDSRMRKKTGRAGRLKAEESYDKSRHYEDVTVVYREALQEMKR